MNEPLDTRWVVITGPPSSGKTTTLELLEERGWPVSPDSTRALISEVTSAGRSAEEFRFADDFQPRVLEAMQVAEAKLAADERTFLEYALPCNIAFHRTEGLDLTPGLAEAARRYRYSAVFILDPLMWENDAQRVEDAAYQQAVHRHMYSVYEEHGYEPVRVPALSPTERIDFILESLGWPSPPGGHEGSDESESRASDRQNGDRVTPQTHAEDE